MNGIGSVTKEQSGIINNTNTTCYGIKCVGYRRQTTDTVQRIIIAIDDVDLKNA